MSKIGRKPITFSPSVKVEIKDGKILINGPKAKFTHDLPKHVNAVIKDGVLVLSVDKLSRETNILWGSTRALLADKINGALTPFEKKIKIVRLGFKAQLAGRKLNFSLGFSHKVEYDLPVGAEVEVDKTGQLISVKSSDKLLLGNVCDSIRALRPPEPYKGTGIMLEGEVIIRKAGKTKAAAAA